ncbi:MAG: hypothetical protein M1830_009115 [Pleopsidium flavum]|nr:MAG: hypothetical protein M1830_009115 [Pleopsidium flavum]
MDYEDEDEDLLSRSWERSHRKRTLARVWANHPWPEPHEVLSTTTSESNAGSFNRKSGTSDEELFLTLMPAELVEVSTTFGSPNRQAKARDQDEDYGWSQV